MRMRCAAMRRKKENSWKTWKHPGGTLCCPPMSWMRSGEKIAEIQMVKIFAEDGLSGFSGKDVEENLKRKTRENETALLERFCDKRTFSEHMDRWTDDKIPDKYDQNFFACSGQPSEEEFRTALRHQRERGDHFIKLESREPLSPDFGLEKEVTLTMALTGDCSAWRENPQVTIRKPEETELVENELRNFGRIYGEDFTVRNAKRNYEKLDYVGAYLDGRLAGSCYVFTWDGVTCIDGLVVNEEDRHQYVATTLLKHIAMTNRENLICLHADADDTPKEMYRKMGFVTVDVNYEYSSSDLDKLLYRPFLHFTPTYGWMNDPNGLVYHDGIYEMYYQHNPKGLEWNCMTWGHARGSNLMQWEDLGDVLYPDENGTMFSGCGIRNDRELLGLQKSALIFFYTAAGDHSRESAGKPFTIRMAYSVDGGRHLVKCGEPVLESLAKENRDPKVFWHEESRAYILVLWIEKNDFGIWRSEDLEHFTLSQRLTLESGFECPDLFRLPVANLPGEERWVFWSADGFYYIGDFDGYRFHQEQKRRYAYAKGPDGTLPYAAQTWSGTEGVLSVSWLRTKCVGMKSTGSMAVPKEFSLLHQKNGEILRQQFPAVVRNFFSGSKNGICKGAVYRKWSNISPVPFVSTTENLGDHESAMEWEISFRDGKEESLKIAFQRATKKFFFTHGTVTELCDAGCELNDMEMIYDHGILEILGNDGTYYLAVDFPELRGTDIQRVTAVGSLKGIPLAGDR